MKNASVATTSFFSDDVFWKLFSQYWWVFLFVAATYGFYSHAMHQKGEEYAFLQTTLATLEEQKNEALKERRDLSLHMASQDDPEYIKLLLKKHLGVVPKGNTKVYFRGQ